MSITNQGNERMATIDTDDATWAPVLQLETDTPVLGGAEGASNAQALALVKRSNWLRNKFTSLAEAAGAAMVGFSLNDASSAKRTIQDKSSESVTPEDFGAVGDGVADDTAAMNAALNYCARTRADLCLMGRTYKMNAPMVYSQRRHSIRGIGHAVIDFRGCPDGTWCFVVADPTSDQSNIWDSLSHSVERIRFVGRSGLNGWKNDGSTANDGVGSPRSIFYCCYFVDFSNHLYFGNNQWCAVFDQCSFRGGGGGSFIQTSRTYNAGENIQFQKCIFNGGNNTIMWTHVDGPFEITFDGCSIDYCLGVLRYASGFASGRLTARFVGGCHFEDNGQATEFDFSVPPNVPFHLEISGCDWFFTGTIPQKLINISSSNGSSMVIFRDNSLPLAITTQDRTLAELISWPDETGRLLVEGNRIESATNTYHNMVSRKASKYPRLNAGNFKPAQGPFVFNEGASPQIVERVTVDLPAGAQGDGYKMTGSAQWTCLMDHEAGRSWNVSGWIFKNSANHLVQMRFYRNDGALIAAATPIAVPGATNQWVRFGASNIIAPRGTVRAALVAVPNGSQTASDFLIACDWVAEQVN